MSVWKPMRGEGHRLVHHLATMWRTGPGQEMRWEPHCGVVDPVEVQTDGRGDHWCRACLALDEQLRGARSKRPTDPDHGG